MLSLAIACWSAFVVIDSLCRWSDAREGCTGVYPFPSDSVHSSSTEQASRKDTGGAL